MAVDYEKWLKDPGANRVLLCDVKYWSLSTKQEETAYLSTYSAGDYQFYQAVITRTPILSRKIPRTLQSSLVPGSGWIDINIADGRFDNAIYNNFSGREIAFKHGDASWSKDDFKTVFTGVITKLEILNDHIMRLNFVDGQGYFDRPLTEATIPTGPNEGKIVPICYGTCYNVTPVIIDEDTRTYKVNNGLTFDVCTQLYVDGVASSATITKNNADGEFTITTAVTGAITCDVLGQATDGPVHLQKPGEIMQDMLTRYGGMDIARIDTDSVIEYDTGAPQIGFYAKDSVDLNVAMNRCVNAQTGFYNINRAGQFSLHKLFSLAAQPVFLNDQWNVEVREDNVPASGIMTMVADESVLKIHKTSAQGADQSAFFDLIRPGDSIYFEEVGDTARWRDFRVTSISDKGMHVELAVTLFGSGLNYQSSLSDVEMTATEYTPGLDDRPVTAYFDDNNIVGAVKIKHDDVNPAYRVDIGYDRNWTVNASANTGDHADRTAFLQEEYRYVSAEVADIPSHQDKYANATAKDGEKSLIIGKADAITQAQSRLSLYQDQHYFIEPRASAAGMVVELGDVVEITTDRFFITNQKYMVLSIDDDLLNSTSEIGGWF